jgi:hypothetical protein
VILTGCMGGNDPGSHISAHNSPCRSDVAIGALVGIVGLVSLLTLSITFGAVQSSRLLAVYVARSVAHWTRRAIKSPFSFFSSANPKEI